MNTDDKDLSLEDVVRSVTEAVQARFLEHGKDFVNSATTVSGPSYFFGKHLLVGIFTGNLSQWSRTPLNRNNATLTLTASAAWSDKALTSEGHLIAFRARTLKLEPSKPLTILLDRVNKFTSHFPRYEKALLAGEERKKELAAAREASQLKRLAALGEIAAITGLEVHGSSGGSLLTSGSFYEDLDLRSSNSKVSVRLEVPTEDFRRLHQHLDAFFTTADKTP